MTVRFVVFTVAIGIAFAGSLSAEEKAGAGWSDTNVREVQKKLRDAGLYFGEVDGAYSSELAAALGRYQIRNGLAITGQLDEETSKALGANAAVATTSSDRVTNSETWRRLRSGEDRTSTDTQASSSPQRELAATEAEISPRSAPAGTVPMQVAKEQSAPAPSPATTNDDRLRDYVGAFVLAGLDPHAGSETDFFADHVKYYNQGELGREKIRKDLQRYAARWPDRRFWLDGDISIEQKSGNQVLVTFPLRYDLRNGAKHSSGKINKTLLLESAGDDFQIVAVNERRTD